MRKLLVVIDMQTDFIDGALGTKEAEAILDNVKAKISSYPVEDIFVTMDTHGKDYLQTQEGRFLPVEHCVKGTSGWQLHPILAEALKDARIFEKPTFGSVKLARALQKISCEEPVSIELIGLCTDICVVSNALLFKAFMPEVPIAADVSCCAGVTPEKHRAAIETMRSCQIEIIE